MELCIKKIINVQLVLGLNHHVQSIVVYVKCVFPNLIIIVFGIFFTYLGYVNVLDKEIINILYHFFFYIQFGVHIFQ